LRPLRLRAFNRKGRRGRRKGRKDKTRMRRTRLPVGSLPDFHIRRTVFAYFRFLLRLKELREK
jgi:hypothetical protein